MEPQWLGVDIFTKEMGQQFIHFHSTSMFCHKTFFVCPELKHSYICESQKLNTLFGIIHIMTSSASRRIGY